MTCASRRGFLKQSATLTAGALALGRRLARFQSRIKLTPSGQKNCCKIAPFWPIQ